MLQGLGKLMHGLRCGWAVTGVIGVALVAFALAGSVAIGDLHAKGISKAGKGNKCKQLIRGLEEEKRKARARSTLRQHLNSRVLRLKRSRSARKSACSRVAGLVAGIEPLARSHSFLAASLQREIAAAKPGKNFAFSPYSIHTALSMLYAGARGQTATEIENALGLDAGTAAQLHALQAQLQENVFATSDGMTLSAANLLYRQKNYFVKPLFTQTLASDYLADVQEADFINNNEAERLRINSKVEELTNNLIKDLFPQDSIDSGTRLVLVNAVYMNALWQKPFEEARPGTFHTPTGDVEAEMMSRLSGYGYKSEAGYETLEIPYRDGATSMYVVVPEPGSEDLVMTGLDADLLNDFTSGLATQSINLTIPKYSLNTDLSSGPAHLMKLIQNIGIRRAFGLGGNADFTGICDCGLVVTEAVHKAVIKVGEQGTEAAASTGIALGKSISRVRRVRVVVDRPFLFIIKHRPTGAILFQGWVADPTKG